MREQYILGFDGGGTKTDCAVYTVEGDPVVWKRYGGTNHEAMKEGFRELEPKLLDLIDDVLRTAGISRGEVVSCVFGAAGVDITSQKAEFEKIVRKSGLKNFLVINDSFLGIKAGTPEGIGCCLVNGTGNTVGGIDASGKFQQVGGMGPMFGDAGGAGLIAQGVIRCAYDELFRMGPATVLTDGVMKLLHICGKEDFAEQVYARFYTGRVADQELVKLLNASAEKGDEVSVAFLKKQGREFAKSLAGCIRLLNFGDKVDIVLVGSVTLKSKNRIMIDSLKKTLPELTGRQHQFYPLTVPPAAGAILWALERNGKKMSAEERNRILDSTMNAQFT